MKLRTLLNLSLVAGLILPAYGLFAATSCGAEPLPASTVQESTPELDMATHRVEQAKAKLDQARQQLSAARAMLKAAEAEFKAARADKEALAARTEARKLADASGLKDDGVTPVQPSNDFGVNRLFPVTNQPVVTTPADLSQTRIQDADLTKAVTVPMTAPATPQPAVDLHTNAIEQPSSVP